MMKWLAAFLLFAFPILGAELTLNSPKPAADQLKSTEMAAVEWLQLLDQGKWVQSWSAASLTFRTTFSKDRWAKLIQVMRKPLGTLQKRKLVMQSTSKDPHNLPKGNYMILVFASSFSNRPAAHELVTLVQEEGGEWRVLTYLVQ